MIQKPEPDEFVTITAFRKRIGVSKPWYYRHAGDPGMPRRVNFGGKVMLPRVDCDGFIRRKLDEARGPKQPRKPRGRPIVPPEDWTPPA